MKPSKKKENSLSEFTLIEKVVVLYYGLVVARDIFFSQTEIAYSKKLITRKAKSNWEHFFRGEFQLCQQIHPKNYKDLAWLEFKVRHLMDLATNISFEKGKAWGGYTVPFENILFPILGMTGKE